MVHVRDIRRQRKDYGRLRRRPVWSLRQIQCRVQLDFVAHRNLDTPPQIIVRRRWRRAWRLSDDNCIKKCREQYNRKRSFHLAILKMNCYGETRGSSRTRERYEDASL